MLTRRYNERRKRKNRLIDDGNYALHYYPEKCTGCGLCVDICKEFHGALSLDYIESGETQLKIEGEECVNCGWCAINCPFDALEFIVENEVKRVRSPEVEAPKVRKNIEVREESCVVCGRCEESCPQGSIEVCGVIRIISDDCTLCGLCRDQCPEEAISINFEKNMVEIDGSSCVRCGACEQICPTDSVRMACLDCLESLIETSRLGEVCDFQFESSVSVDRNRCIYCGRCETVCPAGAIEVRKPFDGSISVQDKDCVESCENCVELCPTDSIKRANGGIVINRDTCIYCGACYRVCSHNAISFERETVGVIDNKGNLIAYIE